MVTRCSADLMRLDDYRIAVGKSADLVMGAATIHESGS